MPVMKSKINMNCFIILIVVSQLLSYCNCLKESVTLDMKLKIPEDDIEKIVKFRKWTTFKVKDTVNKRIGEVKYGSIVVMEDSPEDILERIVYFKSLRRVSEKYFVKIVTKYNDGPHTMEFVVHDEPTAKTAAKVIRSRINVDISSIDPTTLKSNHNQNGWIEYSMKGEFNLDYRIGDVFDGDTQVVSDSENVNIRLRYIHVLRPGIFEDFMKRCCPFMGFSNQKVVRIFTYYYKGERTFDELIETSVGRTRKYVDLVKESLDLDLAAPNSKYFKKLRLNSETIAYIISEEYQKKKKIGRVMNRHITVESDDPTIRIRSVYINPDDLNLEIVEIKTCYREGECQKCMYSLEDNQYNKTVCSLGKETANEVGSAPNLFTSSEELERTGKKINSYLNGVVSFKERKEADYEIVLNLPENSQKYFISDLLPSVGAIFYSLKTEFANKNIYLKITEEDKLIATVDLEKVTELNFIIKIDDDGTKRMFMWVKCGLEMYKAHEVVVVDSLKRNSRYKTRKIEQRPLEIITGMIN